MSKSNYKVLILGGGAGGISVAAKLSRELDSGEIAIVDPADKFHPRGARAASAPKSSLVLQC